jgi:transcriptional regulator with XRE-family HTH domain
MHEEVNKIGRLLRAAREAKGMTQAALSKATDLATRTIMDIENDKHYPTYEVFYKILHVLDLSADHIFWPERVPYSMEREQLIRALDSCSERDKAVFTEMAWAFVRATGSAENQK